MTIIFIGYVNMSMEKGLRTDESDWTTILHATIILQTSISSLPH